MELPDFRAVSMEALASSVRERTLTATAVVEHARLLDAHKGQSVSRHGWLRVTVVPLSTRLYIDKPNLMDDVRS